MKTVSKIGLSGNVLKIIAIISMTIDHVGAIILDNYMPFRIIGRIAFPIFAYLIFEGCFYTKNKLRYFLNVFVLGLICQIGYFCVEKDFHLNILLTFSVSILLIYLKQYVSLRNNGKIWLTMSVIFVFAAVVVLSKINVRFDYSFWGIMLPVLIALGENKKQKLFFTLLGLVILSAFYGEIQFYSLFAIPILFFYNNKRGKYNIKYLFYVFYPVHLIIIYAIDLLISIGA